MSINTSFFRSFHLLGALKMPLSLERSFETVHFHPGFSEQASCLAKPQVQATTNQPVCAMRSVGTHLDFPSPNGYDSYDAYAFCRCLQLHLTFVTSNCSNLRLGTRLCFCSFPSLTMKHASGLLRGWPAVTYGNEWSQSHRPNFTGI